MLTFTVLLSFLRQLVREGASLVRADGWRAFFVPLDMLWCGLRYGASPANYRAFGWRALRGGARKTFITYRDNQRLMKMLNGFGDLEVLDDKAQFARRFEALLGRDVLVLEAAGRSEIHAFVQEHPVCVLKPRHEGQGRGVKILNGPGMEGEHLDLILSHKSDHILEEFVRQDQSISGGFGNGLAAIRLITARREAGRTRVVLSAITVSSVMEAGVVNLHTGGLMAPVDQETGRISGPAVDEVGRLFSRHPESGATLEGFVIPRWTEIVELVEEAAELCPEAGYVGWDVGMTTRGPCLIEGNVDPGTYVSMQRPVFAAGIGARSRVEDLL